ncbi:bark storage protein a-like [Trifolium pratense]|uniref:Bark storage protein a-like n=1 Tax=Trifolium pratense TaxID=57577 RepID=A0A2K3MVT7_TRIPR|nr:bark storage protein a-like [Trifolium pratense]
MLMEWFIMALLEMQTHPYILEMLLFLIIGLIWDFGAGRQNNGSIPRNCDQKRLESLDARTDLRTKLGGPLSRILVRYGQGADDTLPLENNGDYTRDVGFLKFSDFTSNISAADSDTVDNQLNNLWYQPEEIFPVDGIPEQRQHALWVSVDSNYYRIAKNLESLKLDACIDSDTCLTTTPKVVLVDRGTSAGFYLDNAAYRTFIYNKFNVSPVDMESASVALICLQQRIPFIAIRALSDLAGGGTAENEADTFSPLAATNSVAVVIEFVKLLSTHHSKL